MFKTLKAYKILLRRYLIAKEIRNFDKVTDIEFDEKLSIIPNGYLSGRIDDFFQTPGFSQRMRDSSMRRPPKANERVYLDWSIPEFVWETLLTSQNLTETVQGYLGKNARLDDLYVKTVCDGLQSVSEGWHDDNVGYRLKFFMVFDTEGEASGTILIPQKRPNLYQVSLNDELKRIHGDPNKNYRGKEIVMNYKAGDFLLFDTNNPHRGDYSSNEGTRFCLIAEFIDREKANKLRGKAPCGPGQAKFKIKIPKLNETNVLTHALIDNKLLHSNDGYYTYGY